MATEPGAPAVETIDPDQDEDQDEKQDEEQDQPALEEARERVAPAWRGLAYASRLAPLEDEYLAATAEGDALRADPWNASPPLGFLRATYYHAWHDYLGLRDDRRRTEGRLYSLAGITGWDLAPDEGRALEAHLADLGEREAAAIEELAERTAALDGWAD